MRQNECDKQSTYLSRHADTKNEELLESLVNRLIVVYQAAIVHINYLFNKAWQIGFQDLRIYSIEQILARWLKILHL
jgi:hypothetical protein